MYFVYVNMLHNTFTSDHIGVYATRHNDQLNPFSNYISGGRFMLFFLDRLGWILNKIGISEYQYQFILQLILLLFLAISITILYLLFSGFFYNQISKTILFFVLLVSFVNPYFVEIFVYKGYQLGIGILLAILAVYCAAKNKCILGSILIFMSVAVYQSFFSVFIIFYTTYIYFECKGRIRGAQIKKELVALLMVAVPLVINLLIIRVFIIGGQIDKEIKQVSAPSIISFHERLLSIGEAIKIAMVTCFGMMPKLFVVIFLCVIIIITLTQMKKLNYCIFDLVIYIVYFFVISAYCFVIFLAMQHPSYVVVARIVWPMFVMISCMLLSMLFYTQSQIKQLVIPLLVVFYVVDLFFTEGCITDFIMTNKLDKSVVCSVKSEINEYERVTGNRIKYVAAKNSDNPEYYYHSYTLISYSAATYNHKVLYDDWSKVELLNYLTDSQYRKIDMPESVFKEYFGGKTWDTFNASEQLVFDGDTMYWVIY